MPRLRSRQAETEDVNQRRLGRGAVKRQHIARWAVGTDELAPGVVGDVHLHPTTQTAIQQLAAGTGVGQVLVMSATGDSIASGGDHVTFDTIVAQHGFELVGAAGDSWTHPVTGVYVLDYEHAWDSYSGGGTVAVEIDGTLPPEGLIGNDTVGNEGRATIAYYATEGSVGKIKVTQSSGSAKTCDAVVRVAMSDPAPVESAEWTKVLTADVWGIYFDGSYWWTTENATATVSQRDSTWAVVASWSTGWRQTRGVVVVGSSVWLAGDTAPSGSGGVEAIAEYDTTGSQLNQYTTGTTSDGNEGLAYDGTDLWLVENTTNVVVERYNTAGVLQSSFVLPGVALQYEGLTFYDGHLYVVDTTSARLEVFETDGTHVRSIDISTAVSGPSDVWIADDGTLYVSKDGDGVYRSSKKIWEV